MGMKRRVKLKFDPWAKVKPEDYSCHVPWDTDWKKLETNMDAEFGGKPIVLPMPGVLRLEERHSDGRDLWRLVGHLYGCGHWSEPLGEGGYCGVYGGRTGAEGALPPAAHGVCWSCFTKAWEPILKANRKREKTDAQKTTR